MATGRSYFARNSNNRFLTGEREFSTIGSDTTTTAMFELDESDVWNSTRSASPELRKPITTSRANKKQQQSKRGVVENGDHHRPSSVPVNIPDWSKILREEYRDNRRRENEDYVDDDDDDDTDGGDRVPPHEFLAKQLARTRIASFSVHEGIGRTLKGRDLSRVRNAIWEKTGFQD
ncbi:Senescence regulator S40 [Dillenia turbinata]|uniref:Senescence regulator S40 n=1 Tax=Dillenia turbinata TaxID=194707 RepID=A0AAN8VCJ2_9MAGN